jgi:hypothetical protein
MTTTTKLSKSINSWGTLMLLAPLLWAFVATDSLAQSLIVGIPSTDTTPKDKKAIAFELQSDSAKAFGTQLAGFVFTTYGVSDSLEVGVTVLNLSSPNRNPNDSVIAGYKKNWMLQSNSHLKVTGAVGQMAGPSLVGEALAHWNYALVSQDFLNHGVRLTQGLSYANRSVYGQNTASVMLGVEHRWTSTLMGVIDWYSGSHDYAAAIFAVQYRPVHSFLVFLGWKEYNTSKAGAVMTEMAYEF